MDRSPPTYQLRTVQRFEFLEPAAVEHPRKDLAHIKGHPHVGRGNTAQFSWVVVGRLVGYRRAGTELAPAEVVNNVPRDPDGVVLVKREVVGEARGSSVHLGPAELFLVGVL